MDPVGTSDRNVQMFAQVSLGVFGMGIITKTLALVNTAFLCVRLHEMKWYDNIPKIRCHEFEFRHHVVSTKNQK